jgi:DNA-binding NtrC family response regulator
MDPTKANHDKSTPPVRNTPEKHLLVIDDDTLFCDAVSCSDMDKEFIVHTANSAASGLTLCRRHTMDVVLLDQQLPDQNGSDICPAILSHNDRTKIILATAYPNLGNAVEIIKLGAFDYLAKPFDIDDLSLAISRATQATDLEQRAEICSWKDRQEKNDSHFIGSCEASQAVRNTAQLVARSMAPTLLTGATGTGKTLLAKYIHSRSARKDTVFLSVNCATLPENLIEAELFGVEKGAYTDASSNRRGIFEMASGGTLFLDEIGTLPFHLQAKLLGVLDDGSIKRLGSENSRKVDVKILTATNSNLPQAVQQGTFREDLFYRLSVLNVELPTLSQRREDIPQLCAYFLGTKLAESISSSEYIALADYPWPGNIRELKNILERCSLLANGEDLGPSKFLKAQHTLCATEQPLTPPHTAPQCSLQTMEREHIAQTLQTEQFNRSKTAQILEISRSTLIRKMKQYNIDQRES